MVNDPFVVIVASYKTVNYLMGADGNPWVWVLGEDEDESTGKRDIAKIMEGQTFENSKHGIV